jgi:hypothetical protein
VSQGCGQVDFAATRESWRRAAGEPRDRSVDTRTGSSSMGGGDDRRLAARDGIWGRGMPFGLSASLEQFRNAEWARAQHAADAKGLSAVSAVGRRRSTGGLGTATTIGRAEFERPATLQRGGPQCSGTAPRIGIPPLWEPDGSLPRPGDFFGWTAFGPVFWEGPELGWWGRIDWFVPPDLPPGGGGGGGGGGDGRGYRLWAGEGPELDPNFVGIDPCRSLDYQILPPYSAIDQTAQDCFDATWGPGLTDWPPQDCDVPCVDPATNPPCLAPTPGTADFARILYPFVEVTDAAAVPNDVILADGSPALDPLEIEDGKDMTSAGMALLALNLDIVTWACCLVQSWSPDLAANGIDLPSEVEAMLSQTASVPTMVFFVHTFGAPSQGATGSAFNADYGALGTYAGGQGPVIPLGHSGWKTAAQLYKTGTPGDQLCIATQMAGTLIHEIVHVAADLVAKHCEDNVPPWPYCCWEEAVMVASAVRWALALRYPCMSTGTFQGVVNNMTCCNMGQSPWFMYTARSGVVPGGLTC